MGNTTKLSTDLEELRDLQEAMSTHTGPHDFLMTCLRKLPCEPSNVLPSEWAERNRIMPKVSGPAAGKFKWNNAPFFREVLDRLSPMDPVRKVAIMKANQVGYNCNVIENGIGFIVGCEPCPSLLVSGDENLISKLDKTRIEPMIEHSGLGDRIEPPTLKKGKRRTGSAGGMKEFSNGFLVMCGPNNESNFQGLSFKVIFQDEVDLYPVNLGTSGETVRVINIRAKNFGPRAKLFFGSRPTVAYGLSDNSEEDNDGALQVEEKEKGSRILELFEAGDQRKYMVPCPHCGEKQELVFFKGKTHAGQSYGMVFNSRECKAGDFRSVGYRCRGCGKIFREHHKKHIIQPENGAEWVPTATPKERYYVSYHISSLYSPFVSWEDIVEEFLSATGDPTALQAFYNGQLGLPFEDRTGGVEMSVVSNLIGGYAPNTIPKGVLFLTSSVDVQRGKNGRLEVEIRGWGRDWRNWLIDYRIIDGNTEDINDPCWRELAAILDESWASEGRAMQVERMVIDSGDGTVKDVVYSACRLHGQGESVLMMPLKGLPVTARTREYIRIAPLASERFPLLEVYGDNLKNRLALWLKQEWRANEAAPVGYTQFPVGTSRKYFKQLTNDERVKKHIGPQTIVTWKARGRIEAWDCFQYGLACAEFVLEDYSMNVLMLEKSTPAAVWDYFEANAGLT